MIETYTITLYWDGVPFKTYSISNIEEVYAAIRLYNCTVVTTKTPFVKLEI